MFWIVTLFLVLCATLLFILVTIFNNKKHFVKVQCWFCAKHCVALRQFSNSWTCLKCEQYNGFKEDGDYNKPITRQHMNLSSKRYAYNCPSKISPRIAYSGVSRSSTNHHDLQFANGLCDTCNQNVQYKYQILRDFSPKIDKRYLKEYEAKRKQLDELYPLCTRCQRFLLKKVEADRTLVPNLLTEGSSSIMIIINLINMAVTLICLFCDVIKVYPTLSIALASMLRSQLHGKKFVHLLTSNDEFYNKTCRYLTHVGCISSLLLLYNENQLRRINFVSKFAIFTWFIVLILRNQMMKPITFFVLDATLIAANFAQFYDMIKASKSIEHSQNTTISPGPISAFHYTSKGEPNKKSCLNKRFQSFSISSNTDNFTDDKNTNVFLRQPKLSVVQKADSTTGTSLYDRSVDNYLFLSNSSHDNHSSFSQYQSVNNNKPNNNYCYPKQQSNYPIYECPTSSASTTNSMIRNGAPNVSHYAVPKSRHPLSHYRAATTAVTTNEEYCQSYNVNDDYYDSRDYQNEIVLDHGALNNNSLIPYQNLQSRHRLLEISKNNVLNLDTYTRHIIHETNMAYQHREFYQMNQSQTYNVFVFFILGLCLGINTFCAWLFFKNY